MNKSIQRPLTINEVVIKKEKGKSGNIHFPIGVTQLLFGTVLTTSNGGADWYAYPIFNTETPVNTDVKVIAGGKLWKSTADNNSTDPLTDDTNWENLGEYDASGILCVNMEEEGRGSVLTMGEVRGKHLIYIDDSIKHSLFKNKIDLK